MFASFARRALSSSSSSSPLSCCSSSRSIASTTINGVSAGNLLRQTNDPLGAEAEELAFAPNKSPKHNQLFAPSDPIFMSQFLYDSGFIKKQMREIANSSSSSQNVSGEKECAKMLAQIGGTMKSYYKATTGEYDGVVIYSFPKNHDVHTFEQIVKSSGLIEKVYTTKLMTSEDSDVALRAAKELVDKYGGGSAAGL